MAKIKVRCDDPKLRVEIRRAVAKHGLDRRKVYVLGFDGELATDEKYTTSCSGCACQGHDGQCSCPGNGCKECGYTGKRVRPLPYPVILNGALVPIRPEMAQ